MIEEPQVVQGALLLACAMLVSHKDHLTPIQIRNDIRATIKEDSETDDEPMTPERLEELALAFACEAVAERGLSDDAYHLEKSLKQDIRSLSKG